MLRGHLFVLGVVVLAGCGGGDGAKSSGLGAPFDYEASRSLDVESTGSVPRAGGIEIRHISFGGPSEERLSAFLVMPRGSGKHPAVIYAHGAGGSRSELVERAVEFARKGAVGLTLDLKYAPGRAPPLLEGVEGIRMRAEVETESVREVRRAVDLLRSLPTVDDEQLGFVGWSAGARIGAIVAGVDHRVKALDLMAGGASPLSVYLDLAPPELRAELEPVLSETDPLRYVGHAAPSALFFQNGRRDEVVPKEALENLARAGSEPKDIKWYDSTHIPNERAWEDSRRWLSGKLAIN